MPASAANKVSSEVDKYQLDSNVALNASEENKTNSHENNNDNNDKMSETCYNRNNAEHSNGKLPSLIGDCVIRLTHPTCYEPPLYLFPELLPPVPENTAPAMAWDGVADAIDVSNSHWHLANVAELDANLFDGKGNESITYNNKNGASEITSETRTLYGETSLSPSHKRPRAIESLASLVASNKLLEAGIHASVLHNGNFSAASMIEEIMKVKKRAKLDDDEGAVLMTNHFINLLAWCKLREANHSHWSIEQVHLDAGDRQVNFSCEHVKEIHLNAKSINRQEDALVGVNDSDILRTLEPSPTPWSDKLLNDCRVAGEFISGCEHNVEERVESLRLLAKLFRRPLKSLVSRGLQTGYVVPPGTINITSPYVAWTHAGTSMLDQFNEQLYDGNKRGRQSRKVALDSKTSTMYARSIQEGTQLPFVVIISSGSKFEKSYVHSTSFGIDSMRISNDINNINNINANMIESKDNVDRNIRCERNVRVVNIIEHTTNFGREEGVQFGANAQGGPVVIQVGIGEFSTHAMQIAPHHFSLVVLPKKSVKSERLYENELEEASKPFTIKSEKELDDNDTGEKQENELITTLALPNKSTETFLHERNNDNETHKETSLSSIVNEQSLHEQKLNNEKGVAASAADANAEKLVTEVAIKREEELESMSESRQMESMSTSLEEQQFNTGIDNSATSNNRKCDGNIDNKSGKAVCENKFDLWLVNYARNGVYVNKHGWVLANCKQLERGDDLNIGSSSGSSSNEKNNQINNVHIHIATEEETCRLINREHSTHDSFEQNQNVSAAKSTPSAAEIRTVKQEKHSDDDDDNDNDLGSYVAGLSEHNNVKRNVCNLASQTISTTTN